MTASALARAVWVRAAMLGSSVWYKDPDDPEVVNAQTHVPDDEWTVVRGRPYFLIRDTLEEMGRHTRANYTEVFRWMYGRDPQVNEEG